MKIKILMAFFALFLMGISWASSPRQAVSAENSAIEGPAFQLAGHFMDSLRDGVSSLRHKYQGAAVEKAKGNLGSSAQRQSYFNKARRGFNKFKNSAGEHYARFKQRFSSRRSQKSNNRYVGNTSSTSSQSHGSRWSRFKGYFRRGGGSNSSGGHATHRGASHNYLDRAKSFLGSAGNKLKSSGALDAAKNIGGGVIGGLMSGQGFGGALRGKLDSTIGVSENCSAKKVEKDPLACFNELKPEIEQFYNGQCFSGTCNQLEQPCSEAAQFLGEEYNPEDCQPEEDNGGYQYGGQDQGGDEDQGDEDQGALDDQGDESDGDAGDYEDQGAPDDGDGQEGADYGQDDGQDDQGMDDQGDEGNSDAGDYEDQGAPDDGDGQEGADYGQDDGQGDGQDEDENNFN